MFTIESVQRFGATCEPSLGDAIDGVLPRAIIEPETPEALAAALAYAARERLAVVLRGGGTKLGWGRPPERVDLLIGTRRLNRVLAHRDGDLTATIEAGAPIAEVNRELMRRGQWLPVDAWDDAATIGGAIATNDSGPLRQRHGTPRDLLIGIQLATTEGRLVRAGGTVVKNVAGYDLGKLVCGSFGTLAAVAAATFKLAPVPAWTATLVAQFADAGGAARAAAALAASPLEPVRFEVEHADTTRLLVQFASTRQAVEAQISRAAGLVAADRTEVVIEDAEHALWRRHVRGPWERPGTLVRVSWLPADLQAVLAGVREAAPGARAIELVGRAGVGAGLLRIDAGADAVIAAVQRLRAGDRVGHVVVLRTDPAVKRAIDVWGSHGDRTAILGAIKRAFDPQGILNAGRGPI